MVMAQAGGADPLVAERAHRHLPAGALVAEPVGDRHPGVGEEHLAEHALAGDVPGWVGTRSPAATGR